MNMQMIILIIVVVIIVVFIVVSSITSKKAQKKEQAKRKKVVREEIKNYISKNLNLKNIRVEYEKVYARKGAEYKYRDVFDVIVQMFDAKTNELVDTKSFEIEGVTTRADKKTYQTAWHVNVETNIEETQKRIAIAEKKVKLTKAEMKTLKEEENLRAKAEAQRVKELAKENKIKKAEEKKENSLNVISPEKKAMTVKFIPKRNK